METKFTPGPWLWVHHGTSDRRIALVSTSTDTDVLLCTGSDSQAWGEASEADGRLIQAAPDLLHHLSILAAEDSQCASDWVKKKEAARLAIQRATEGRT